MAKVYFAVLAIGKDTPGIVAAITGVLSEDYAYNVEASQMTILGGHFATTLIASSEELVDYENVERSLEDASAEAGLRRVYVSPLDPEGFNTSDDAEATHTITAHASDRSGVLHEIAKVLADSEVNITSLTSGCSPKDEALCVTMLEVALPNGMREDELEQALRSLPIEIEAKIESPSRQR